MIFRFTGILQLRLFAKNSRKIALSGLFLSKKKEERKGYPLVDFFRLGPSLHRNLNSTASLDFPTRKPRICRPVSKYEQVSKLKNPIGIRARVTSRK